MTRTRAAERLTRSETGELDLARAHLHALVAAARAVSAVSRHDPDRGDCDEAGCALAHLADGPVWCRAAHRLSMIDVPTAPAPVPDGGDVASALATLRDATLDAQDAVRTCRSIGHAEGQCWFAGSAGGDVCGEVLRLAHRCG